VWITPAATSVAVTCAFGTTAPLGSFTTPEIEPVTLAHAAAEPSNSKTNPVAILDRQADILPSG
jgi:hypothetical protein